MRTGFQLWMSLVWGCLICRKVSAWSVPPPGRSDVRGVSGLSLSSSLSVCSASAAECDDVIVL